MTVLALSGWAQVPESMLTIVPEDSILVGYGDLDSVEATFKRLSEATEGKEIEVAVGWSLGGQLLVRAIAAGIIKPKRLVLIGAPYQLIADAHFKGGKNRMMVATSRLGLLANPALMLEEFQAQLLAIGDDKAKMVKSISEEFVAPTQNMHWLFWFDELGRFSCRTLDFSDFPPTDIIHGKGDFVIPFASGEAFATHIPNSTLHALENCGHAPQWHDAELVKRVIKGE